MSISRLLMPLALVLVSSSCIPITVNDNPTNELNKNPKLSNIFFYSDRDHNVQFTALISGKLVLKNDCLFLNNGEDLVTPVFNVEHAELNIDKEEVYIDHNTVPLNENLLFGGGFLDSEYLPKLDVRASDACLTSRVAVLHSIVEDTPEFKKRWLISD